MLGALTRIATARREGGDRTTQAGKPGARSLPPRAGQGGARAGLAQARLQALAVTRGEATEKQQETALATALLPWRQGRLSRERKVDRY